MLDMNRECRVQGMQAVAERAPGLPSPRAPRTIVVAAGSADESLPPLAIAAELSQALGASVRVVSALGGAAVDPAGRPTRALAEARAERAHDLRKQVRQLTHGFAHWPIEVAPGAPASVILATLHDGGDLLLTGLRPHDAAHRVFREETVVDVLRRATVPVLAAVPMLRGCPRRILAAVDFSRGSLQSLGMALRLAAPGASIVLAHVEPGPRDAGRDAVTFGQIYRASVESAFRPLESAIAAQGFTVRSTLRSGDVAEQLLALAEELGSDLIATGLHRYPAPSRPMPGSVTAALVRAGRCSVLVSPPM
jgi:nucleotide-binding universal stress UspA family protein